MRASAVVVSTQHAADVKQKEIRETLIELLIKKVMPPEWLDAKTAFLINPTGRFVIGGPEGDAGITGHGTEIRSPSRDTTHSPAPASVSTTLLRAPHSRPSSTWAAAIMAWPAPPCGPAGV